MHKNTTVWMTCQQTSCFENAGSHKYDKICKQKSRKTIYGIKWKPSLIKNLFDVKIALYVNNNNY